MLDINYIKLNIKIKFNEGAKLNKNKSSALRGILGNVLIDCNCIKPEDQRQCKVCYFNSKCIANNILSSKLNLDLSFLAENIVCPFVLNCDNKKELFKEDETLEFSMTIFGDAIIYVPHIIYAYQIAGMTCGIEKNNFTLEEVKDHRNNKIFYKEMLNKENIKTYKVSEYVKNRRKKLKTINEIKILSPIRYKKNNKISHEILEEDIINLAKKRILILNALEGNEIDISLKEDTISFLDKNIKWVEIKRFSNRQKSRMNLGGIIGSIDIEYIDDDFINLLIALEITGIGKSTSLGMGKIKVSGN